MNDFISTKTKKTEIELLANKIEFNKIKYDILEMVENKTKKLENHGMNHW